MRIYMLPHNPQWPQEFEREARQITDTLGGSIVTVYHIGSTAIPSIYAKPVIDILLVVRNHAVLDTQQTAMEALGYEALGEFGIPSRRYFRRDNTLGDRTHQIHAFEIGSPQIARHLAFRDYMINNPNTAQAYSDLKRALAAKHPDDSEAYMDGKDAFIREIDHRTASQALETPPAA